MNATALDNQILFPVGRLVSGDLYVPQDKDQQGNKLTIKTGANVGKERVNYFFTLAILKTPGVAHWGSEPGWGAKVWAFGHAMWPALIDPVAKYITHPRFAWKVEDGDSTIPNQNNRKNCEREGYPGHWIVKFGSSFPTKVFDANGDAMPQPDLVKPGFYIEVWGSVASNENVSNPGIYMNHSMVAYRAPGAIITSGPDPRTVGFGKSALPAGVMAAPTGNAAHFPAGPAQGVPGAAVVPGAPPAAAAPPAAPAPVVAPAQPTAVAPNPSFITPPGAGGGVPMAPSAPAAPAAPAAPVQAGIDPLGAPAGYRMAAPTGPRYESYRQQGWTDVQLIAIGHMVKL